MHLHHLLRKQQLKHRVQNKHYFPEQDNKIVVETSNLMQIVVLFNLEKPSKRNQ
jgi:hypothetical protein